MGQTPGAVYAGNRRLLNRTQEGNGPGDCVDRVNVDVRPTQGKAAALKLDSHGLLVGEGIKELGVDWSCVDVIQNVVEFTLKDILRIMSIHALIHEFLQYFQVVSLVASLPRISLPRLRVEVRGRIRAKIALLLAAQMGLVTPVMIATRWDPIYEDPAPKAPSDIVLPADFQVPRLAALPQGQAYATCARQDHVVMLDLHALTRDGQELARTPADTSKPMLLPGDVLVPNIRKPDGLPEGVCLLIDARTPFAFARTVLRSLMHAWAPTVVERADGTRGRLELLPEAGDDVWTPLLRVHKGSVTINGVTIPALPSGEVDGQTLDRVFEPKWSFSVLPDDDVPFGEVVAVVARYADSEFTDPALVVGPPRFSAGILPPYKVVDLGAGSSESFPMP